MSNRTQRARARDRKLANAESALALRSEMNDRLRSNNATLRSALDEMVRLSGANNYRSARMSATRATVNRNGNVTPVVRRSEPPSVNAKPSGAIGQNPDRLALLLNTVDG